jgi:hypothetical protein
VRDRLALHAAAATIAVAIWAPLARPGYVLSYDMLFVPRQPVRWDLVAPIDSPPRAVPLDALVSLASQVIPGWLLQRVVLVVIVWAAVVGAARLVPAARLGTRLLAGVAYGWTPFLAERLLLGQWGLLVAYAALPWLVSALLRYRECLAEQPQARIGSAYWQWRSRRARALAQIVICAGLSAITPTGGLIAAAVCLSLTPRRRCWLVGSMLLVLNSPWIIATLASRATSRSDPAGVAAFAPRGAMELLATGGIWNAETTPASRTSFVIPILTVLFVALAIWGYRRLRFPAGLTIVALAGLALAIVSTLHIGQTALAWLVTHVPGAGILRDAQKFVLSYALLLALCVALGAQRLVERLPAEPARVVLAGVMLLPIFAMPDLAWGGAGALRPVRYPPDWPAVAAIVGDSPGEVLSLPLSEYRHYPWNHGRTVIDVAPRYLPAPVLTDDTLVVGDVTVAGENPRLAGVRAWLHDGAELPAEIAWVLVQGDPPATPPAGLVPVYSGRYLALYHNPGAVPSTPDGDRRLPVLLAELAALALMILAAMTMAVRPRR